jgi:hypothetical protein
MDVKESFKNLIMHIIVEEDETKNLKDLPLNIKLISKTSIAINNENLNEFTIFYSDEMMDQIIFRFCEIYSHLNINITKYNDLQAEYNIANILIYRTRVPFNNIEQLKNLCNLSSKYNEKIKSFEENIRNLNDINIEFIFSNNGQDLYIKYIDFLNFIN